MKNGEKGEEIEEIKIQDNYTIILKKDLDNYNKTIEELKEENKKLKSKYNIKD